MSETIAWIIVAALAASLATWAGIRYADRRRKPYQSPFDLPLGLRERLASSPGEQIGDVRIGPPEIERVDLSSLMSRTDDASAVKFNAFLNGRWQVVCYVEAVGTEMVKVRPLGSLPGNVHVIEVRAVHPQDQQRVRGLISGDPSSRQEVAFESELQPAASALPAPENKEPPMPDGWLA